MRFRRIRFCLSETGDFDDGVQMNSLSKSLVTSNGFPLDGQKSNFLSFKVITKHDTQHNPSQLQCRISLVHKKCVVTIQPNEFHQ